MTKSQTIFAIFFLQAFSAGSIFARVPDIQSGLGISESILGLALVGTSAGGLAANLFSGRLVEKFGTRGLLLVGIPGLALLSGMIAIVPSAAFLFVFLLLSGACFSITNVAMNVEADRIEVSSGGKVMNRCHGFWSMGMLLAAAIGVGARAIPISTVLHLWGMVIPVLLLVFFIVRPLEAAPRNEKDPTDKKRIALPSLRTFQIMLFGISAGIGQMAAQNWSVIYMRDTFAAPDWFDTLVLPAYLVSLTAGRIFADGWMTRFGARKVAFAQTSIAALGVLLVAGSPFGAGALFGFALMGLGSAVHFPLMITASARSSARPAAEAISATIFLVGFAMTFTPGAMGWMAEVWGLRTGFAVLVVPFVLTLMLVRRVVVDAPKDGAPS